MRGSARGAVDPMLAGAGLALFVLGSFLLLVLTVSILQAPFGVSPNQIWTVLFSPELLFAAVLVGVGSWFLGKARPRSLLRPLQGAGAGGSVGPHG